MSYTMSKGRGNCPGGENVRGKMSGSPQRSEVDVFIQSVWDNSVVGVPVTVGAGWATTSLLRMFTYSEHRRRCAMQSVESTVHFR